MSAKKIHKSMPFLECRWFVRSFVVVFAAEIVCNVLFWNAIAYHSASCVFGSLLIFFYFIRALLIIFNMIHNLHAGESSFKLHVRFSTIFFAHSIILAPFTLLFVGVSVVVAVVVAKCYWFLRKQRVIKALLWWNEMPDFASIVLDSSLQKCVRLLHWRWLDDTWETTNANKRITILQHPQNPTQMQNTKNIYKFYWFFLMVYGFALIFWSWSVVCVYECVCVRIFFRIRFWFSTEWHYNGPVHFSVCFLLVLLLYTFATR